MISKAIIFVSIGFLFMSSMLTNFFKKTTNYSSAIQLKQGNYWVYSNRHIHMPDSTYLEDQEITTSIKKDTLIEGKRFYRSETNAGYIQFLRDSSGCLINEKGYIVFSAANTTDTLYNRLDGFGRMTGLEEEIWVQGKKIKTVAYEVRSHFNNELLQKCWYAKKIGLVRQHIYYKNSIYALDLKKFKVTK